MVSVCQTGSSTPEKASNMGIRVVPAKLGVKYVITVVMYTDTLRKVGYIYYL